MWWTPYFSLISPGITLGAFFLMSLISFSIIVSIMIFLLFVLLTSTDEVPIIVKELPYDYSIQQTIGFVLDDDALHFGGSPVNTILKRNITLTSEFPAMIKINFKGPGNLSVNENNFFLNQNVNKSLEFILVVPDEMKGNYSGSVFFEFYEP